MAIAVPALLYPAVTAVVLIASVLVVGAALLVMVNPPIEPDKFKVVNAELEIVEESPKLASVIVAIELAVVFEDALTSEIATAPLASPSAEATAADPAALT